MLKIIQVADLILNSSMNIRQIAEQVSTSHHLVKTVRAVIAEKQYALDDILAMDEDQLKREFRREDYQKKTTGSGKESVYMMPDCEYFASEALKYDLSYTMMYEEYAEQCNAAHAVPYKLTQFKKYVREYISHQEFSEIMIHRPGDEMEVDWVGDKAFWTDPDTDKLVYAWMFIGVLTFSGLVYAEVFYDMKERSWIAAHVHMFEYFSGITRVLVCDNLKTGVLRHPKDTEAQLQKDYAALSHYYHIAVVPARVRKPNDKPLAENSVRFAEDHLIKKLRHAQCFSIDEYNKLLRAELDKLNSRPFTNKEGSRRSAYEKYEKAQLQPLPAYPYKFFEKKKATVQKNCCIAYAKNYYSVPYKKVKVRMTVSLHLFSDHVEIWNEQETEKLCEHELVSRGFSNIYVIDAGHMPPKSFRFGEWDSDRFRRWAGTIGPYTYEVINAVFENPPEQKYYNRAHAILNLGKTYTDERLEQACRIALRDSKYTPNSKTLKKILESEQDLKELKTRTEPSGRKNEKAYTRGAEYYGGNKEKR